MIIIFYIQFVNFIVFVYHKIRFCWMTDILKIEFIEYDWTSKTWNQKQIKFCIIFLIMIHVNNKL